MTQRQNNNLGLTENFYYDDLHRLDRSELNGVVNLDMTYDAMGNITNRTDVSSNAAWQYDTVHKHQVKQAGSGNSYTYDANGNMITRSGNTITWTSYNYPSQISGGSETINLYYDANRQRYKQTYSGNGTTETTLYIGGLLQRVTANGVDDYRYTITANGQTIAIMSRTSSGTNATRYVLNDYQGSVAKFTDSSGNSIVSESFTAFGARRNPQTWSGNATYGDQSTISNIAREGYTGQTALGMLGLNHMNGRVQDAITGMFLSADPYITERGNTQNYNRYSYVYNNPMSLTDPSGFDGEWETELWGVTVTAFKPFDWFGKSSLTQFLNNNYTYNFGYKAGNWKVGQLGLSSTTKEDKKKSQTKKPGTCSSATQLGNKVADASARLGDVSTDLLMASVPTLAIGLVTGQPEIAGPGAAIADVGALAGGGSGVLQVIAGALQVYGGSTQIGWNNVKNGSLTMLGGWAFGKFLSGSTASGYRTVSQRASDQFLSNNARMVGGGHSIATSLINGLSAQQAPCP